MHNFKNMHTDSVCICLRKNIIHYIYHYVLVSLCYHEHYVIYLDVIFNLLIKNSIYKQ